MNSPGVRGTTIEAVIIPYFHLSCGRESSPTRRVIDVSKISNSNAMEFPAMTPFYNKVMFGLTGIVIFCMVTLQLSLHAWRPTADRSDPYTLKMAAVIFMWTSLIRFLRMNPAIQAGNLKKQDVVKLALIAVVFGCFAALLGFFG